MKKFVSLAFVFLFVLLLSTVAIADTAPVTDNTTAEIPVSIRQEFIDDSLDGQYLASLEYEDLGNDFFAVEGVYHDLVQPASLTATMVYGTKQRNVYYAELDPVPIMTCTVAGEFSVPFDGTAATCTSAAAISYNITYSNASGYTFSNPSHTTLYAGENGSVTVYFDVYWKGEYRWRSSYGYITIACDPYGNVY